MPGGGGIDARWRPQVTRFGGGLWFVPAPLFDEMG